MVRIRLCEKKDGFIVSTEIFFFLTTEAVKGRESVTKDRGSQPGRG